MTRNSENIEAKLAAYIDGDLDQAGREEIEQYLQTNPNHRRLLVELGRTHTLLGALPREAAPPEIAEEFNSQLERSALLSEVARDVNQDRRRVNHRPPRLSLAAIVLLTVGLGVVLYLVLLPSSHVQTYTSATDRPYLRMRHPSSAPASGSGTLANEGEPAVHDREARLANKPEVDGADALAVAAPTPAARRMNPSESDEQVAQQLEQRLDVIKPSSAAPGYVMVIQTDDPSATQDQVLSFLSVNGIEFEPVALASNDRLVQAAIHSQESDRASHTQSAPTPNSPSSPTTELAAVQPEHPATPREAEVATQTPSSPDQISQSSQQAQPMESDVAEPTNETMILAKNLSIPQARTFAVALPRWRAGQRVQVYRLVRTNGGSAGEQRALYASSTQPSPEVLSSAWTLEATVPSAPFSQNRAEEPAQPLADATGATSRPSDEPVAQSDGQALDDGTHRQSAQPSATPSDQVAGESAQTGPPATQSVDITSGDWLSVQVQLADEPQRVYVVRVDDQGQINLPALGAAPAAGTTLEALGEQLTAAYRASRMILARAVEVQRAQPPQTPAPAVQRDDAASVNLLVYVVDDRFQEGHEQTDDQPASGAAHKQPADHDALDRQASTPPAQPPTTQAVPSSEQPLSDDGRSTPSPVQADQPATDSGR